MSAKKTASIVSPIVSVSLCEVLETKQGLPLFLEFFPEVKHLHGSAVVHAQEAETYGSMIHELNKNEIPVMPELKSMFSSALDAWEEKEAAICLLENKYINQHRDFIVGKTKIVTPDQERMIREQKARLLHAQTEAIMKVKYPNRVKFTPCFSTSKKYGSEANKLQNWIAEAAANSFLNGVSSGELSLQGALDSCGVKTLKELSNVIGAVNTAQRDHVLDVLTNDPAARIEKVSFSLKVGKSFPCVSFRVHKPE